MTPDEVRGHPYWHALNAVGVGLPDSSVHLVFWTRVLNDHDRLTAERDSARGHHAGALADVRNLGAQLTEAVQALDLARRPAAVGGGTARPLTPSAQEALVHALTRPQSELDPRALFPPDCTEAVVLELEDHGLVVIDADVREVLDLGSDAWWRLGVASATLTPLALTLSTGPT